ncbi:MAG: enoyl-CoA hydratase [Rhodoferax sp.]|nr:enoyl-CoA hydratase [Rhodoferax sp.]
MTMQHLTIENRGAVRVLTLSRPDKHNALNTVLTQELLAALRDADVEASVNAVVLTGAGRSFCAGADTTEFSALVPDDPGAVTRRADLTTALHLVFSQMAKPVVAAVRGNALGGGAGLALACDLLVASDSMRFGYPELKHGIVAAVVLANLVRQVGKKQAFELVALAEPIDGARALALGLANRSVPDAEVLATALAMAEKLAGWSPIAMATTKRTFHRVADLTLAQALDVGRDANVMMRGFKKPATTGSA